MKIAVLLLSALALLMPVASGAQQIESLEADAALASIQQMRGVVLVDLYADW